MNLDLKQIEERFVYRECPCIEERNRRLDADPFNNLYCFDCENGMLAPQGATVEETKALITEIKQLEKDRDFYKQKWESSNDFQEESVIDFFKDFE